MNKLKDMREYIMALPKLPDPLPGLSFIHIKSLHNSDFINYRWVPIVLTWQ